MLELIRQTLEQFCLDFLRHPYLCYTEHGQHALYFSTLFAALPEHARFGTWQGQKVSMLQKEYPTATHLGKSQRQHWDIALLKSPLSSRISGPRAYDYLLLQAAIEFGMNEAPEHLRDDIKRLTHPDCNMDYGFVVHLHRLSDAKSHFSGRDWSPTSARFLDRETIHQLVLGKPVEVYFAVADQTRPTDNGAWLIPSVGPIRALARA